MFDFIFFILFELFVSLFNSLNLLYNFNRLYIFLINNYLIILFYKNDVYIFKNYKYNVKIYFIKKMFWYKIYCALLLRQDRHKRWDHMYELGKKCFIFVTIMMGETYLAMGFFYKLYPKEVY